MLDDYKTEQSIVYRTFCHAISKEKLSHAYLLETRGYPKGIDLALAFAKSLLCPKHYTNNSSCKDCQQCNTIDTGNFTEIKIIEPDGLWIKKEQLTILQSEFSKKALVGDKKVYIIHGAEFLNSAAANSILKFLEEPEENIIAILICENSNQVMETIVSRCQNVSMVPKLSDKVTKSESVIEKVALILENSDTAVKEFINSDTSTIKVETVIHFIEYYEMNGLDTLLYIQKLWFDQISEKDKMIWAFQLMVLFYKDILNKKQERPLEIFEKYDTIVSEISNRNTISTVCQKISIILSLQDKILCNMNLNLLMDKLILELEEGRVC